jgi:hypothetical protein
MGMATLPNAIYYGFLLGVDHNMVGKDMFEEWINLL